MERKSSIKPKDKASEYVIEDIWGKKFESMAYLLHVSLKVAWLRYYHTYKYQLINHVIQFNQKTYS